MVDLTDSRHYASLFAFDPETDPPHWRSRVRHLDDARQLARLAFVHLRASGILRFETAEQLARGWFRAAERELAEADR